MQNPIAIVMETGSQRTFACTRDWPGWSRSGRDEAAALHSLLEHAPRYGAALSRKQVAFPLPESAADFEVVARLPGDTTTDFGAPGQPWQDDPQPLLPDESERFHRILRACWQEFELTARSAAGRTLRTGPRGGGRDLSKMTAHVLEAETAYLRALSGETAGPLPADPLAALTRLHAILEDSLDASIRGEIAAFGPRGGRRWTPRFFVRRVAWHALDHAWEIQDRLE